MWHFLSTMYLKKMFHGWDIANIYIITVLVPLFIRSLVCITVMPSNNNRQFRLDLVEREEKHYLVSMRK